MIFLRPFERFIKSESAGGIILFVSTVIAMIWANSPLTDLYTKIFNYEFGIEFGNFHLMEPLWLWINDGLMAIFFYVVGLEIKREITTGELNSVKKAVLPIAGALGGMLLPVLMFLALNTSTENMKGWAIPMATDIAFAMGIIRLFSSKVSRAVVVFLTALAIVDDLGAVIVIALFYTAEINFQMLGLAALIMALLLALNYKKVSDLSIYLFIGFFLWLVFMKSGIHPTIAGVILGFFTPGRHRKPGYESPLHRGEKLFLPWVNFVILPVFGLANAGITIDSSSFGKLFSSPLALGIILGLFFGKQLGITLFAYAAVKLKIARLSEDSTWRKVYGAALLGGIGFTMSIFIAGLSMESGEALSTAKLAIIAGSLISAIAGSVFLLAVPSEDRKKETLLQSN